MPPVRRWRQKICFHGAGMLLEMERPVAVTPSSESPPPAEHGRSHLATIGWIAVLICVVLSIWTRGTNPKAYQIQFDIVSDVPFKEDTPRTTQLITRHQDGTVETLIDKRYASAFIDRRSTHRFEIPSPQPQRFLFSPAPPGHMVAITGITVFAPDQQVTSIPLDALVPDQQVQLVSRTAEAILLKTLPGTDQPTLEMKWNAPANSSEIGRPFSFQLSSLFGFLAAAILLTILLRNGATNAMQSPGGSWVRFAQYGGAAALILAMATVTKFNAHPDEYLHFEAAKYYSHHWIPPVLSDPEIQPSFSHYGVSYLQDIDSAYFAIGGLLTFVPSWLADPEIAARLCNVLLFVLLTGWLVRRLPRSFAPAILLASPQLWYAFSYVNSDAWALALSMVAVVQLADPNSLLAQYLRTETWRTGWRGALLFVTLMVLIATAKRNYLLFLAFIGLVAVAQIFLWPRAVPRARLLKRWTIIGLTVALIYLPIRVGHEAINHFDKAKLRTEQAEKFAAPQFKPSEIAAGTGAQRLALRRQGVPYTDLFIEHNWAGTEFPKLLRSLSMDESKEPHRLLLCHERSLLVIVRLSTDGDLPSLLAKSPFCVRCPWTNQLHPSGIRLPIMDCRFPAPRTLLVPDCPNDCFPLPPLPGFPAVEGI